MTRSRRSSFLSSRLPEHGLGDGAPARRQGSSAPPPPRPKLPRYRRWTDRNGCGPYGYRTKPRPACSPLSGEATLVSRFGPREDGAGGGGRFHTGCDFVAPRGTVVLAVRPGVVERVVRDEERVPGFIGYGNVVVIRHTQDDCWTWYAHLDEVFVAPGLAVELGDRVGRLGNTTNGRLPELVPRLHFEVRVCRQRGLSTRAGSAAIVHIDPQSWLARRGVTFDDRGLRLAPRPATPPPPVVRGEGGLTELVGGPRLRQVHRSSRSSPPGPPT